MPSASCLGSVIQSPGRNMSFTDNSTPATNPIIGSLNTSISTAAIAPRPVSTFVGFLSMIMLMIIIAPTHIAMTLNIWNTPFKVLFLKFLFWFDRLYNALSIANANLIPQAVIYMSSTFTVQKYISPAVSNILGNIMYSNIGGIIRQQLVITSL